MPNNVIVDKFSSFIQRFNGKECGFHVSQEDLDQFSIEPTCSKCDDKQLQTNFEELHAQSNTPQPGDYCGDWRATVVNI